MINDTEDEDLEVSSAERDLLKAEAADKLPSMLRERTLQRIPDDDKQEQRIQELAGKIEQARVRRQARKEKKEEEREKKRRVVLERHQRWVQKLAEEAEQRRAKSKGNAQGRGMEIPL
jgi:hypothetical protein